MNTPSPTKDDLAGIKAELISIEREIFAKPKILSTEDLAIHLTREINFQRAQIEYLRQDNQKLREALRAQTERAEDSNSFWTNIKFLLVVILGLSLVLKIAGVL